MEKYIDNQAMQQARKHWDSIAHPLHGLGTMEDIVVQIAGITGKPEVNLAKKSVLIFCGDNGISETKVSQSASTVTAMVADELAEGKSSVNKMAAVAGAFVKCIDVGIKDETHSDKIIDRKVVYGTKNFLKEPALTVEQAKKSIEAGTGEVKETDADIIAVGEMGIADTTCAAIITASLLNLTADQVTGRGAGLDDDGFLFKKSVIESQIHHGEETLELLARIGGTEIGAMTGAFIGGALYHKPTVADGAVSLTAALLAERLCPGVKDTIIASNSGREKMSGVIIEELGFKPVIHADISLGEGTGAVMLFPLLDQTLAVYNGAHSFDGMELEPYKQLN